MDLRHEHCGGCGALVHWDGDLGPARVSRTTEGGDETFTYTQDQTTLHVCGDDAPMPGPDHQH